MLLLLLLLLLLLSLSLSLSLLLLLLLYAIHWLILFSVTEFPGQASITDLLENDTIKSLARSSIAYSACSSFTALSGNSDLHLLSTGRRAAVHSESEESEESDREGSEESDESEDESDSDEEDDKEHREPIDHLLKVGKRQSFLSILWLLLTTFVRGSCITRDYCYNNQGLPGILNPCYDWLMKGSDFFVGCLWAFIPAMHVCGRCLVENEKNRKWWRHPLTRDGTERIFLRLFLDGSFFALSVSDWLTSECYSHISSLNDVWSVFHMV